MKRILVVLMALFFTGTSIAQVGRDKTIERVQQAGTVLEEIMSAPDSGIPEEIFGSAKCIGVVPSLLKGGFWFGGAYGKGVASCRTEKGWSAPAFFSVKGGSFGLQIGGEAVDLVMVIMNDEGMKSLLSNKFKLGADGSVAAGPVGRHAEGSTDWKMQAQVLTYSRARGIFAGLTVNGSVVSQGTDDTRAFYGHMVPYKTILTGGIPTPQEANPFTTALMKYSGSGAASSPSPTSGSSSQPGQ
jgi:SH3 domain-containing YSC84-like protein 1